MQLMTSLVRVMNTLADATETSQRQLDAEKRRKGGGRVRLPEPPPPPSPSHKLAQPCLSWSANECDPWNEVISIALDGILVRTGFDLKRCKSKLHLHWHSMQRALFWCRRPSSDLCADQSTRATTD